MSRSFQRRRRDWADSCLVFVLFVISSNNRGHYGMTTNNTFFQHGSVWFLQKCPHITQLRLYRQLRSGVLYKGNKKFVLLSVRVCILTVRSLEYGSVIRAVPLIPEILLYCING